MQPLLYTLTTAFASMYPEAGCSSGALDNSDLLATGIYYPSGSLKARSCLEGAQQLYQYCTSKGIPHRRLGKLVVATSEADTVQLQALYEKGRTNGSQGLELLSASASRHLEPELQCSAALLSPDTGIIDSHR